MKTFWFLWAMVCVCLFTYNLSVTLDHPDDVIYWMATAVPMVCALYSLAKAVQK